MSRIIAGAAGGVRLASVPGDNTRPTTDRVKESLFSKLESYDLLRDARVLDAFGGSGALGCEALSSGAASEGGCGDSSQRRGGAEGDGPQRCRFCGARAAVSGAELRADRIGTVGPGVR